jgi:hypothetical protein
MADKAQRARSAEQRAADQLALVTSGHEHHFRAGSLLSIGGLRIPRGATLPREAVEMFTPDRLRLMLRNNLLVVVLGPPPKDDKAVVTIVDSDPDAEAKERAAMIANAKAAGEPEWTWDPKAPKPAGAYTITRVPAPERSAHDQSFASNRNGAITGT